MIRCARNDAERNNIAFKGLDVVRQYALKIFKTAESSVYKVGSSCEKNPSVHWMHMNFLRQRKTALDVPLYAVSLGRSLLPQCALDATGFLSDVYKRSTRAKKFLADDVQGGKSMIEMLGVLAIVGVLSVGGIAGYSKAMEKFKVNKIIGEYNQLIMWILENQLSLKKLEDRTKLANVIIAANVLPADWSAVTDEYLSDGKGNLVQAYVNLGKSLYNLQPRITIDFNLGGLSGDLTDKNADIFSTNFSDKLCFELFNNLIKPLHSQTIYGYVFKNHNPIIYWGDAYCGQTTGKCLNNITLTEIKEICSSCDKENERCNITIGF